MSVSKEQHEHPVGVQPRHHREPAEKNINRKDPVHHFIKGNIWKPAEHKQTHKKRPLVLWRGKTKWNVPQPRNANLKNRGIKTKLGAGFYKKVTVYRDQLVLWSSPQLQFLPSISCVLPCPPISCGSPVCVSKHIVIISPAYTQYINPGFPPSLRQIHSQLPACSAQQPPAYLLPLCSSSLPVQLLSAN